MGYLLILGAVLGVGLALVVWKFAKVLYAEWASPLRVLPGPPNTSLLYGNMKQIWDAEAMELHEKWVEEYGSTIKYKGFLGATRLYTTDMKALNHILMNSAIYQKPENARFTISEILGDGVLVVEGDKHKQQRKIMVPIAFLVDAHRALTYLKNPAFGAAQIRELTEIFVDKSLELCNVWTREIKKKENNGRINVLSWLSRMTLDVIGLAGFNYDFAALTSDHNNNELNRAFQVIFHTGMKLNVKMMLRTIFPALRSIIPTDRTTQTRLARQTMADVGEKLLAASRTAVCAENEVVEKSSWKRRDLLSLLMRANMATDLPPNQRMSDDDVLAQIPTFLVAGHETTSTAMTWALYALTQSPEVQAKLRNELLSISTDNPSIDELNGIPYLDAVLRESLRLYAPVPSTLRVAVKDDVLPLGYPVRTTTGDLIKNIQIRKGQTFFIPILAINRSQKLWGPDARIFKPERWLESRLPEAVSTIPGVWGNMLTFLGGPRACIGYRFALIEMKALLFTLVRAFEFELAVPPTEIIKKAMIVQRPVVASEKEKGNQMPLRLKPVQRL